MSKNVRQAMSFRFWNSSQKLPENRRDLDLNLRYRYLTCAIGILTSGIFSVNLVKDYVQGDLESSRNWLVLAVIMVALTAYQFYLLLRIRNARSRTT